MVLIRTSPSAAPSIAYTLGGQVRQSRWVVVPHFTETRAAKLAAEFAGDNNPTLVNFDFKLGLLAGALLPVILWGAYATGLLIAGIIKQVDTDQSQTTAVVSEQELGAGPRLFHEKKASQVPDHYGAV